MRCNTYHVVLNIPYTMCLLDLITYVMANNPEVVEYEYFNICV